MRHRTHHTDAIVLAGEAVVNDSRQVRFFTEAFGLLSVHVQSVARPEAKFHSLLEPGSVLFISLVRGRARWRLTGAELRSPSPFHGAGAARLPQWHRIASLVSYLFAETPEPEAFAALLSARVAEGEALLRAAAALYKAAGFLSPEALSAPKRELVAALIHAAHAADVPPHATIQA